jgi:hypothetical protein
MKQVVGILFLLLGLLGLSVNPAHACNSAFDDAQHELTYHHTPHKKHSALEAQAGHSLSPHRDLALPLGSEDWGHCHCPNCGVSFSSILLSSVQGLYLPERPAVVSILETIDFFYTQHFPQGGAYGIWRPPKV